MVWRCLAMVVAMGRLHSDTLLRLGCADDRFRGDEFDFGGAYTAPVGHSDVVLPGQRAGMASMHTSQDQSGERFTVTFEEGKLGMGLTVPHDPFGTWPRLCAKYQLAADRLACCLARYQMPRHVPSSSASRPAAKRRSGACVWETTWCAWASRTRQRRCPTTG